MSHLLGKTFLPCFLLIAFGALDSPVRGAATKPNVIIFLMDDMGYGDIHALNPNGCGIPTPHLDEFVKDGAYFVHAHSSSSVCAPSRYALLTGNHVYRGTQPMGTWGMFCPSQIKPGQRTIADVLRSNGYSTAFFGKLHLGGIFYQHDGAPSELFDETDLTRRFTDGPIDHGFDYSLTLPAGIQASPYAFFENDRLSRWSNQSKSFEPFEDNEAALRHFRKIERNNRGVFEMDNWTTQSVGPLLMHSALRYIDKHVERHGQKKPFYIHYCSQAGHSPYVPPAAFNVHDPMNTEDLSADGAIPIAGKTISKRTDMIYEGDVALGLFIAKLRDKGILDDTLIIFTSDNGVAKGIHSRWESPIYTDTKDGPYGGNRVEFDPEQPDRKHVNGQGVAKDGTPLRGKKGFTYEGGHRVPLIFRWGAKIPKGKCIENQLIGLHDVFSTIAALTGSNTTARDGRDSLDFSSVLLDASVTDEPVRKSLYIQGNRPPENRFENERTMTWAAYHVVSDGQGSSVLWKAIISNGRNTLKTLDSSKPYELFDLTNDPGESAPQDQSPMLKQIHSAFIQQLQKNRTAIQ
ncbi:MAG: sulfatase-like hydrolase/transferase [Pirellulales bacterium]|nr:sulfatase-like hydrolase/transferase [Pirellulales bacterium]